MRYFFPRANESRAYESRVARKMIAPVQMQQKMALGSRPVLPVRAAARPAVPRPVVCRAFKQPEHEKGGARLALPVAALVATALVSGAIVPDEALAAKSQGRVGSSSGFKSKAPASRSSAGGGQ